MNKENHVIEIDKKFTRLLFKAVIALRNDELGCLYNVEDFYLFFNDSIREKDGVKYYTVRFLSEKITRDNWMDIGAGGIEIQEVNVDIEINTHEVIAIYGGR